MEHRSVRLFSHLVRTKGTQKCRWFGHLVRTKGTQMCEIVWSPGESEGNTEV